MRHARALVAVVLTAGLVGPVPMPSAVAAQTSSRSSAGPAPGMDAAHKRRAERLTSLFENSTPTLDYAYVANLDDGRGYTSGRAGFTTATGDALIVVERWAKLAPRDPLARFLPELRRVARAESDAVGRLGGYATAWRSAARSPRFRAVQDTVVDELYYRPAMVWAQRIGLRSNLAKAVLYDTIVQHGEGDDPDGLAAVVRRANAAVGGRPSARISESRWLTAFLRERRKVLAHAFDPATRAEWAESVGRVDALAQILRAGNLRLDGPIRLRTVDYDITVP